VAEFLRVRECCMRGDRISTLRGEDTVDMPWAELASSFTDRQELMSLRFVHAGDYIGTRTKVGDSAPTTFVLTPQGTGAKIDWLLKHIPDFTETVETVFVVEEVHWDSSFVEPAA
jgi:hypothetical protein